MAKKVKSIRIDEDHEKLLKIVSDVSGRNQNQIVCDAITVYCKAWINKNLKKVNKKISINNKNEEK